MQKDLSELMNKALEIARAAGDAVMEVYGGAFTVDIKEDQSPLTEADRKSHELICGQLSELTPEIPILSEESYHEIDTTTRQSWTDYWLVDPLDGTKEFIRRNGEFTVNIALIRGHAAELGVVHVPARNEDFFGARSLGAWRSSNGGTAQAIQVTGQAQTPVRVVGSRSHRGSSLDAYLEKLGKHIMVPMGSSLKLCLVAAGEADIYPRLGPTSEWDTAAAQAVVEAAGGGVIQLNGQPLIYNKGDEILNPHFIVFGDHSKDWTTFC